MEHGNSWYTKHSLTEVQRRLNNARTGLANYPGSPYYENQIKEYTNLVLAFKRELAAQLKEEGDQIELPPFNV